MSTDRTDETGGIVAVDGVPVDEIDLIDFLHVVEGWAGAIVNDATVGLTLAGSAEAPGHVVGPTTAVQQLMRLQALEHAGPRRQTLQSRGQTVTTDVAAHLDRWPLFAAGVIAAGYQAIHTFPVRLDTVLIGAVDIFLPSTRIGFSARTAGMMQAVLDVATWGLIRRRAQDRPWTPPVAQQYAGVERRMAVEQATGVLAETRGITTDEAFTVLREHARQSNRRLFQVAQDVLDGDLGPLRP